MVCNTVKMPGGGVAIVCGPRRRRNLCQCGAYATLQCDWPSENRSSGTCDKPICKGCARHVGPETDYCPFHRGDPPQTQEQLDLAGEREADNAARILGVKRP